MLSQEGPPRAAEGPRVAALRDAAEAFFWEGYPDAERNGDAAFDPSKAQFFPPT